MLCSCFGPLRMVVIWQQWAQKTCGSISFTHCRWSSLSLKQSTQGFILGVEGVAHAWLPGVWPLLFSPAASSVEPREHLRTELTFSDLWTYTLKKRTYDIQHAPRSVRWSTTSVLTEIPQRTFMVPTRLWGSLEFSCNTTIRSKLSVFPTQHLTCQDISISFSCTLYLMLCQTLACWYAKLRWWTIQ